MVFGPIEYQKSLSDSDLGSVFTFDVLVQDNIVCGIAVVGNEDAAIAVAGKFHLVDINVGHGGIDDLAILLDHGVGFVDCGVLDLEINVGIGWGIFDVASLNNIDVVGALGHGTRVF